MLEATTTPNANAGFAGRAAGWLPQSQSQSNSRSPRKNRRRRESKGVYHSSSTIARCAPSSPPRNAPNSSHGKLPAAYSYSHMPSRPIEQMRPRSEAEQPFKVESVDYFKSQYNDYDGGPAIHPQNRAASSWQSDMISYTLAPQPAGSNQFVSDNIPSQNGFSFDVSNDLASSWNEIIPNRGNIGIGMNNPPALDIPLAREARYGSLDSVPGCSPKSSGTSNSDGYVFPLMPPGVDQNQNSGTDQLCDFELSGRYLDFLAICEGQLYEREMGRRRLGFSTLLTTNVQTNTSILDSLRILHLPSQRAPAPCIKIRFSPTMDFQ